MRRYRSSLLIIGLAVSVFLFWIAIRNINFSDIRRVMLGADYRVIFPLTGTLLVFYWVRTYRWVQLLRPISAVDSRDLFGPVMIGYGANFLLPFQLGEVARSYAAQARTGLPFMPIAFSIVVERLFDILVILLALTLALLLQTHLPAFVSELGFVAGIGLTVLIAATVLVAIRTEPALRMVDKGLTWLPCRVRTALVGLLRAGATGLHSIRNWRVLALVLLNSLVQWSMVLLCIWLSLYAVNVIVSLPTALLILALVVLGSTVPNAPGYIGSIQAGYVIALEATGGDAASGFAASVIFHTLYASTAIALGLFALRRAHLDLRKVSQIGKADTGTVADIGL